mmetsp:Transcript_10036/g.28389  ORF Transcript_10036/g.28389 Transcript_10036/m.28389 type:complete len:206 (+) Transcript_10036:176-793(+)
MRRVAGGQGEPAHQPAGRDARNQDQGQRVRLCERERAVRGGAGRHLQRVLPACQPAAADHRIRVRRDSVHGAQDQLGRRVRLQGRDRQLGQEPAGGADVEFRLQHPHGARDRHLAERGGQGEHERDQRGDAHPAGRHGQGRSGEDPVRQGGRGRRGEQVPDRGGHRAPAPGHRERPARVRVGLHQQHRRRQAQGRAAAHAHDAIF